MRKSYAGGDGADHYAMVCERWRKIFLEMDYEELIRRFGSESGDTLIIRFLGRRFRLDRNTGIVTLTDSPETILNFSTVMCVYHLFYYSRPDASLRGVWVPFRQVKGAAPFDPAFCETILKPLAKTFSGRMKALKDACKKLEGYSVPQGDVGFVISVFDSIPVTVLFWDGDDEFEAQANLLFDAGITDFLHEETVVILASELVRRLTEEAKL